MKSGLKKHMLVLLAASALSVFHLMAQKEEFATWTSIKATIGISQRWGISSYAEYCSMDNLKQTDRWNINVGTFCNLKPWLKLEGSYELHYYQAKGDWSVRHRYKLGAQGNIVRNAVEFSLRERLQRTASSKGTDNCLRSRLKVACLPEQWKVNPYASVEVFQPLGDGAFFTVGEIRFHTGFVWNLSGRCSLDVFYCRLRETGLRQNILGTELGIRF
ncbi:MAG TPA: DUF2490 domain-containing protein [Candidatus Phocaeicola excrementigallinarum]|nr:DUF2490 domain-containing protein [Candidatus Phocaeicola excrementigallinarum]